MTTEAINQTTDQSAERAAWRAVKHADGPAGAAWIILSDAEPALRRLQGAGGLLAHLSASPHGAEPDELGLLADQVRDAAAEADAAVQRAMDLIRELSQGERRAKAERSKPDPERAEATARQMAKIAVQVWREHRAELRQHRAAR